MKNDSSRKAGAVLLASAVAGLLALNSAANALAEEAKSGGEKVKCYGANKCAGQGACAGAGHDLLEALRRLLRLAAFRSRAAGFLRMRLQRADGILLHCRSSWFLPKGVRHNTPFR